MRFGCRPLLAVAALSLSSACASSRLPELGTGDVSFRLVWQGLSDLDLHVVGPDGGHLSHAVRSSPSGGTLDVDCNADVICAAPVENVFWPLGVAPAGRYVAWARVHRFQEGETSVTARLLVLRGDSVVASHEAPLADSVSVIGPFKYSYAGAVEPLRLDEEVGAGADGRWACATDRILAGMTHGLELSTIGPGTLHSPEPTPGNTPTSIVSVSGSALSFAVLSDYGNVRFEGTLEGDVVVGKYFASHGTVQATCVRY
jgi:hypothetical protein